MKCLKDGLYIVAAEAQVDRVWNRVIGALSSEGISWQVDCLDCLYETNLCERLYSPMELQSALKGNIDIFSARMIAYLNVTQRNDASILTLQDYLDSGCESMVLCADKVHFEVFSKNSAMLEKAAKAIADIQINKMEWVDRNQCGRREFIV